VCTRALNSWLQLPQLPPAPSPSPYTTLFRSARRCRPAARRGAQRASRDARGWAENRRMGVDTRPNSPGQERFVAEVQGAEKKRRSEEHTSELQSRVDVVCRLSLETKNY